MPRTRAHTWFVRIPWHNWIYAAYFLFIGTAGLLTLGHAPSTQAAASPLLVIGWGGTALIAGVVGMFGALRPNYRVELFGAYVGILSTVLFASTILVVVIATQDYSRVEGVFAAGKGVWPLLLRIVYIRVREEAETTRIEAGW